MFKGLESECAYTRFQRRLFDYEQEVEQIFHDAADLVQEVLPDYGQALAIDGKEQQTGRPRRTTMSARSTATGGVNRDTGSFVILLRYQDPRSSLPVVYGSPT